jgi:uncharacterized protein (DUF736 family)
MASEGYGFLFPVKEEDKKERGPTASGTAILNGVEVKVAAWPKTSKGGTRYFSLKFENYELNPETDPDAQPAANDDIPF